MPFAAVIAAFSRSADQASPSIATIWSATVIPAANAGLYHVTDVSSPVAFAISPPDQVRLVFFAAASAAFDDAAVSMVHRSDPVPAPPADLTEDQFSFSLDVNYNKSKQ